MLGRVSMLRRYPVKSPLGEDASAVHVDERGLAHDRRYGLVDRGTGGIASAKHPRLWRDLLTPWNRGRVLVRALDDDSRQGRNKY